MKILTILCALTFTTQNTWALSSALKRSMAAINEGEYLDSSEKLYRLLANPRYAREKPQIRFYLGQALKGLKLYQVATLQFAQIIKAGSSKWADKALSEIVELSFQGSDPQSLSYAISKIDVNQIPKASRDIVNYRIGEAFLERKNLKKSASYLRRVSSKSNLYGLAQYSLGVVFTELNDLKSAYRSFTRSANARAPKGIEDDQRIGALLGRARTLYELQKWNRAISAYKQVPRASYMWPDAYFESSWAMLRSGKFRSALSSFQSLHSKFYEYNYNPESYLLRSIVYLYICRYKDAEKVLKYYESLYNPVAKDIRSLRKYGSNLPDQFFKDFIYVNNALEAKSPIETNTLTYNILMLRSFRKDGSVNSAYETLNKLNRQNVSFKRLDKDWQRSGIGRYSEKALKLQMKKSKYQVKKTIGQRIKEIYKELKEFNDQKEIVRFEIINNRKEQVKKKITGRNLETKVGEKISRNFYVKNGYEYWPFQGEYWADEIGSYHFVGGGRCR